ncbi:MAG TPA: ATP-dependent Clp protease ATP-binding subunit ClpA, partial [Alcanivorax sp.]|nr:ATP-dependent Clp protease ATP-binding subunit ClpA [Alcanivorax sp.]
APASALESYASNLNELARADRIDPLVGRAFEIERAAQILCRRRKNNPLLVGEPGVGKTAIAEGLA